VQDVRYNRTMAPINRDGLCARSVA